MDLWQLAFESLNHEFLIAKLKCFGLEQHEFTFLQVNYQIATSPIK